MPDQWETGAMSDHPSTERFEQPITIAPEDIDFFEHVNNVVYLRWVQEVSVAAWMARATGDQKANIGWVVKRHEIEYLDSARLGDELVGRTWVGGAERHIFERYVDIVRVRDQKVLARARSLWCPVDMRTRRLMRVGPDVYERFSVPTGTHPTD
jgi:acyl-CoA thioester hydrolase